MTDIPVTAPYDGSVIDTVPNSTMEDVENAMATAHALYRNRDGWLSKPQRIDILRRAAEIIKERREDLALQAAREGGKPLMDSLVEIDRAADGVENCVEVLRSEGGRVIPMSLNPSSTGRVAFTQFEPIGPVVAVSAFNHPFNLIVHQVTPAIAVGCPVVVKPADITPLSCFAFVDILYEAGLPKEWCQIVVPQDLDVASALVSDERNAFFSFIGSARVGWMLRSKLALARAARWNTAAPHRLFWRPMRISTTLCRGSPKAGFIMQDRSAFPSRGSLRIRRLPRKPLKVWRFLAPR